MFQRDSLTFLHSYTTKSSALHKTASSSFVAEAPSVPSVQKSVCTKRKATLVTVKAVECLGEHPSCWKEGRKEGTDNP